MVATSTIGNPSFHMPNNAKEIMTIPIHNVNTMNIFFRSYLSTIVPLKGTQNIDNTLVIRYTNPKYLRESSCAKYQGMAIILIPCATPDIALAMKSKMIAFLFNEALLRSR